MVEKKVWGILNVSLVLVSVLLLLSLFDVELPTLGKAEYALDGDQELCVALWQDDALEWEDINRCCLEARKQLSCIKDIVTTKFGETMYVCQTGQSSTSIRLNTKAYNYCQLQPFW